MSHYPSEKHDCATLIPAMIADIIEEAKKHETIEFDSKMGSSIRRAVQKSVAGLVLETLKTMRV